MFKQAHKLLALPTLMQPLFYITMVKMILMWMTVHCSVVTLRPIIWF